MHLGQLAAELFLAGTLPRSLDAFLYHEDRLLCHLELRPGRRCARRPLRSLLRQLMQQPITYHPLEIEWANERGIKLADSLWQLHRMARRWRELSERPPLPAFYVGALCQRPRGRAPRSLARLVLPPALCKDLHVVVLVPQGQLLPEPCTLYYREHPAPRCPVAKAPWQVLGACHLQTRLDPATCPEWHLLRGEVEAYALPVVEGSGA